MVGCAACAGRWVLLGALLFLASDALGCLSACYFEALKTVNKQTKKKIQSLKATENRQQFVEISTGIIAIAFTVTGQHHFG